MSREINCKAILDSSEIRVKAALGQTVVEYVGESTLVEHSIHLELEDGTGIDIPLFYDDDIISAAVTTYTPAVYDGKIVESASLDGETWYTKPTEIWTTLFDSIGHVLGNEGEAGYLWLADLGDIYIEKDSVWRITWNGTEYRCTSHFMSQFNSYVVGGDDEPFVFYNAGWGAWIGDTPVLAGGSIQLKVEYLTNQ